MGPIFAFVIWVAARSLIILWTTEDDTAYNSAPTDLEPLLHVLKHLASKWPCSQRYFDFVQLILDTKNDPNGPTGLDIFSDTRRTAYGLHHGLGALANRRATELFLQTDDFLEMPLLDISDLMMSQVGNGMADLDAEWL